MKECGKKTVLEVVAYTEEECLQGTKIGALCGVDCLLGTKYYESVHLLCEKYNMHYMPFIGDVYGRPSVLSGSIDEMVLEVDKLKSRGVYGVDLLGYRYTSDKTLLNKTVTNCSKIPVCIAGSIDSYKRIDEVLETNARFFTIGGAFFERKFGNDIKEEIDAVCKYLKKR